MLKQKKNATIHQNKAPGVQISKTGATYPALYLFSHTGGNPQKEVICDFQTSHRYHPDPGACLFSLSNGKARQPCLIRQSTLGPEDAVRRLPSGFLPLLLHAGTHARARTQKNTQTHAHAQTYLHSYCIWMFLHAFCRPATHCVTTLLMSGIS